MSLCSSSSFSLAWSPPLPLLSFLMTSFNLMNLLACEGPQYSPKLCCGAFKDFACPYADELNDLTNDCASTMFSYINLYGKYPPGLFVSECREGKEGLECPAQAPSTESAKDSVNASRGQIVSSYSMLTLLAGFLVLLFHLS
ncbi:hypothetical protein AAG906_021365 [Vitis piasezkii]